MAQPVPHVWSGKARLNPFFPLSNTMSVISRGTSSYRSSCKAQRKNGSPRAGSAPNGTEAAPVRVQSAKPTTREAGAAMQPLPASAGVVCFYVLIPTKNGRSRRVDRSVCLKIRATQLAECLAVNLLILGRFDRAG